MATQTTRDNQNLQNTANQRFEELKPNGRVTGAGETSTTSDQTKAGQSASSSDTNSSLTNDGNVDSGNRDVETVNASDRH